MRESLRRILWQPSASGVRETSCGGEEYAYAHYPYTEGVRHDQTRGTGGQVCQIDLAVARGNQANLARVKTGWLFGGWGRWDW